MTGTSGEKRDHIIHDQSLVLSLAIKYCEQYVPHLNCLPALFLHPGRSVCVYLITHTVRAAHGKVGVGGLEIQRKTN